MTAPFETFEEFVRQFKKDFFDSLAHQIPAEALRPGHEAELEHCLERLVDARLIANQIPVGRQGRKRLIELICADIQSADRERFAGG